MIDDLVAQPHPRTAYAEQWDVGRPARKACATILNLDLPVEDWAKEEGIADEEIASASSRPPTSRRAERAERFGPDIMGYVEKIVLLQTLDHAVARAPGQARPSALRWSACAATASATR